MKEEKITHTLKPVIDPNSKILILGTMPSPKSRETGFYYGHPQNRFWRLLADVYEEELPKTVEEKLQFLHRHHIALWDTLASCTIKGASDASIKEARPNDIEGLVKNSKITQVFVTGKKAEYFYKNYCHAPLPYVVLPSPSSANQTKNYAEILEIYRLLKAYS